MSMDWIDPASLRRVAAAYDRYADEAEVAVARLPWTYREYALGTTEIGISTIDAFRKATWDGPDSFYERVRWQARYARQLAAEFRRQASVFEQQDQASAEGIAGAASE